MDMWYWPSPKRATLWTKPGPWFDGRPLDSKGGMRLTGCGGEDV